MAQSKARNRRAQEEMQNAFIPIEPVEELGSHQKSMDTYDWWFWIDSGKDVE